MRLKILYGLIQWKNMNKLKTFFYSLKRSAFDPNYYPDILKVPFSFSWKYLYMLSFFAVLVGVIMWAIPTAIGLMTTMPASIQEFKKEARNAYPPELEVQIVDGKLSTNVEEPYFIDPVPAEDLKTEKQEYEHFITIDTMAAVDDYTDYGSLVLVTEDAVVYPDNNRAGYRVMDLGQFNEDILLNQKVYNDIFTKVSPFIDMIPGFLVGLIIVSLLFGPIVGGLFVTLGHMMYLLLASLITWIVAKMFKVNIGYPKAYQLGMHGVTLPIIITTAVGMFLQDIPYLFSAIFFLWMAVILSKMDKNGPEVETAKAVAAPIAPQTDTTAIEPPVVVTEEKTHSHHKKTE